ncbi:MAG: T9SS type A sorting domain-containing protein [Bacteroidales bacterium]|nr:T9SS type A sorting domain-containing protein [Bacteroidales bacterium]
MRTKNIVLLLSLLAGFMLHGKAQNVTLVVTNLNGTEQSFPMTDEGRMFFENGERLVIDDGTGTPVMFELSEVRKLVCTEITGMDENAESSLQLIPNPIHNSFIINHLKNTCLARVYTLDGRLVKAFEASEGMSVDISELAEGMYLLHIDGQTLKMMKL